MTTLPAPALEPTSAPSPDDRAARKAARRASPMEPELRYKVLSNTLKLETDFLDLADRKARFALVIMSVLNAVALVAVMRSEALGTPGPAGLAMKVLLVAYGGATIHYIWQAIEALRPRGSQQRCASELPLAIVPDQSMRMLFHADIAGRDRAAYRALWSEMRLENVNAELADQVHLVSGINVAKFSALGRLYRGVGVMTVLLTVILLVEGAARIVR